MKTPDDWWPDIAKAVTAFEIDETKRLIAEIQRDARDGMVPAHELEECQKAILALDAALTKAREGMVDASDP